MSVVCTASVSPVVNAPSTNSRAERQTRRLQLSQTYQSEPQLHQGAPTRASGHQCHLLLAGPGDLHRDHQVQRRNGGAAPAGDAASNKGLTITLTDNGHRSSRAPGDLNDGLAPGGTEIAEAGAVAVGEGRFQNRKTALYHFLDGLTDYIKHINKCPKRRFTSPSSGSAARQSAPGHERSRDRDAVERRLPESIHTSPTSLTRMRAYARGFRAVLMSLDGACRRQVDRREGHQAHRRRHIRGGSCCGVIRW